MEHLLRIDRARSRAEALNLTLSAVCRAAGVPMNNISRWTNEQNSPLLRVFNRQMDKIERWLDAEEKRLRELLVPESEAAA